MENDRCVLVCVTSQKTCERLIKKGASLAEKENCNLLVLSVFPTNCCFRPNLETIGVLDRCARENSAEMILFYNDFPFIVAASIAKKYNAINIITGFRENQVSPFVTSLHTLLPEMPITMVDNEDKSFVIRPVASLKKQ